MVALDNLRQRLHRRQRLAVAGIHVPDLALGDRHQRLLVDAVLPREQPKVQPAAQHLRLEARLAAIGDDPAFRQRALVRPELLHNAHAVVRNIPDAQYPRHRQQQHQQPHNHAKHDQPHFHLSCHGKHCPILSQAKTIGRIPPAADNLHRPMRTCNKTRYDGRSGHARPTARIALLFFGLAFPCQTP